MEIDNLNLVRNLNSSIILYTKRNETKRNVFSVCIFAIGKTARQNVACTMNYYEYKQNNNLRLPDANHQIIDWNTEILYRRYTVHSVKIPKMSMNNWMPYQSMIWLRRIIIITFELPSSNKGRPIGYNKVRTAHNRQCVCVWQNAKERKRMRKN